MLPMKTTKLTIVAIATALALTGGCAKKKPADLPPPPVGADGGVGADGFADPTGGVGTTGLGGARADFLQNVQSDRVYFATDSHSLDGEARAILDTQAAWLARNPSISVTIEGHADERGTREYNLALGDRRANAAKNYLAARGVAAQRMNVISWGKERPVAEGSDESAWAQNRRAVTVIPN
jgi:peptidoglycan-associated lipoprotein